MRFFVNTYAGEKAVCWVHMTKSGKWEWKTFSPDATVKGELKDFGPLTDKCAVAFDESTSDTVTVTWCHNGSAYTIDKRECPEWWCEEGKSTGFWKRYACCCLRSDLTGHSRAVIYKQWWYEWRPLKETSVPKGTEVRHFAKTGTPCKKSPYVIDATPPTQKSTVPVEPKYLPHKHAPSFFTVVRHAGENGPGFKWTQYTAKCPQGMAPEIHPYGPPVGNEGDSYECPLPFRGGSWYQAWTDGKDLTLWKRKGSSNDFWARKATSSTKLLLCKAKMCHSSGSETTWWEWHVHKDALPEGTSMHIFGQELTERAMQGKEYGKGECNSDFDFDSPDTDTSSGSSDDDDDEGIRISPLKAYAATARSILDSDSEEEPEQASGDLSSDKSPKPKKNKGINTTPLPSPPKKTKISITPIPSSPESPKPKKTKGISITPLPSPPESPKAKKTKSPTPPKPKKTKSSSPTPPKQKKVKSSPTPEPVSCVAKETKEETEDSAPLTPPQTPPPQHQDEEQDLLSVLTSLAQTPPQTAQTDPQGPEAPQTPKAPLPPPDAEKNLLGVRFYVPELKPYWVIDQGAAPQQWIWTAQSGLVLVKSCGPGLLPPVSGSVVPVLTLPLGEDSFVLSKSAWQTPVTFGGFWYEWRHCTMGRPAPDSSAYPSSWREFRQTNAPCKFVNIPNLSKHFLCSKCCVDLFSYCSCFFSPPVSTTSSQTRAPVSTTTGSQTSAPVSTTTSSQTRAPPVSTTTSSQTSAPVSTTTASQTSAVLKRKAPGSSSSGEEAKKAKPAAPSPPVVVAKELYHTLKSQETQKMRTMKAVLKKYKKTKFSSFVL
ncbi:protein ORF6 [Cyprinid herpesvirus 1]|uniref:Protein ORF6 n=1 Tax=Cyprinid herpesvirus 1 TaxID=317858 RepID=K7PBV0_9VIRU|nr:protein ORF6 [Cyprinid herpesvirus 1]YP_007003820.1 protein ORF6 [Cyprinid herpesvirus 1]AFJ20318.1 protein ORF6 [Cyprinid herpesvirus 1]AFJ20451.1 protein ORF6 [Cyprinid herpesvirus 1]